MKTQRSLALILAALALLAGAAVYAQNKAGEYEPATAGRITRLRPQTPSTDATYDVGPFPTYRPALALGDGRVEVAVYCNTCHSPNFILMQPPLPAQTWAAEVTKMEKILGADIPDEVTKKIIHYLQSNYTPETRKH